MSGDPPSEPAAATDHDAAYRARVLQEHGASGEELVELLAYTRNRFAPAVALPQLPLDDEAFAYAWEDYLHASETEGVWACLRSRLVQLQFPIEDGMSEREGYRAATRRGAVPPAMELPSPRQPNGIRLLIHPTPAGRIPIVIAEDRDDFVMLVQALSRRNEPVPVPDAMGACIVSGYNNWERMARHRTAWETENGPGSWALGFREIAPKKHLYQDRFILLSCGPYSGVAAEQIGLSDEAWARHSLRIRLEHECIHYFTLRVFGSMLNSVHDELLADYAAITTVFGSFRADWCLRFFGLENYPRFRPGGRLETYRGDPPLSDAAFRVLQSLVVQATHNLASFQRTGSGRSRESAPVYDVAILSQLPLEALADPAGFGERVRLHERRLTSCRY